MRLYDPNELGLHVVRVSGNEAYCICPFHHDKTPSASFNMEKGLFHCFGCGESMGARRLAHELGGTVSFVEHFSAPSLRPKEEWEWIMYQPLALDNPYLQSRRVSNELVKRFGIRALEGGVAFPLTNERGVLTGMQVRRTEKGVKPKYFYYGERGPLWPLSELLEAKKGEHIFIVEGVFGVLRGVSGGRRVVASMSASAVKQMVALLNGRPKTVVFDADFAGQLGAAKLVALGGFDAIVPGAEADELEPEQWAHIEDVFPRTNKYLELAALTDDPARVTAIARKFAKSLA